MGRYPMFRSQSSTGTRENFHTSTLPVFARYGEERILFFEDADVRYFLLALLLAE